MIHADVHGRAALSKADAKPTTRDGWHAYDFQRSFGKFLPADLTAGITSEIANLWQLIRVRCDHNKRLAIDFTVDQPHPCEHDGSDLGMRRPGRFRQFRLTSAGIETLNLDPFSAGTNHDQANDFVALFHYFHRWMGVSVRLDCDGGLRAGGRRNGRRNRRHGPQWRDGKDLFALKK